MELFHHRAEVCGAELKVKRVSTGSATLLRSCPCAWKTEQVLRSRAGPTAQRDDRPCHRDLRRGSRGRGANDAGPTNWSAPGAGAHSNAVAHAAAGGAQPVRSPSSATSTRPGGASDIAQTAEAGADNHQPPTVTYVLTLHVNYRTPKKIMRVATAVLRAEGLLGSIPPRSVRSTGEQPRAVPAPSFDEALEEARAARRSSRSRRADAGTVAVIVPVGCCAHGGARSARPPPHGRDRCRPGTRPGVRQRDRGRAKPVRRPRAVRRTNPRHTRLTVVHVEPLPDAVAVHLAERVGDELEPGAVGVAEVHRGAALELVRNACGVDELVA